MAPSLKKYLGIPKERTLLLVRKAESFRHKYDQVVDDPQFRKDILALKNHWDIQMKSKGRIINDVTDLKHLRKKYKIGAEWDYILRAYVETGKFESMGDPHAIEIVLNSGLPYATIKIFPETTQKELRQAHSRITKEWRSEKTLRNVKPKNADRDSFIYMLRKQGKSYGEISELLKDNYPSNDQPDYGNLKRIVNKMKTRRAKIR
jgi:hypothetical protein